MNEATRVSTPFFKPSDIVVKTCTIMNVTRGGSAFGVCEGDEQVFISAKIMEIINADVGDMLNAYCIDNHRPEVDGDFSARWRAIRANVTERLIPLQGEAPAAKPDLAQRCRDLIMGKDRAWTSRQIAEALNEDTQKVSTHLRNEHNAGRVASASICAEGGQDRVSALYFAKSVDVLVELIDGVVIE
jgi:hypothetical protein